MKTKSLKIPAIIIAVGILVAVVAAMLAGVLKAPTITEHDFPYSVTYKLDGETHTLEGVYRCRFISTGKGTDPLDRYYEGHYLTKTSEYYPAAYAIAQKDGHELCIITGFSNKYLMGDTKGVPESTFLYDPFLAVVDNEGVEHVEPELLEKFDAEIISWEQPVPVENSFAFAGFSLLHDISMIAMLVVGILVILACMIFVKRDKTVPYKILDKLSVVMNVIITFVAIPFTTVVALLMQIYVSGDEFVYQVDLCVPAVTAFTIAASIALRRKGFTKTGFFVQFIGPALFALSVLLESVM